MKGSRSPWVVAAVLLIAACGDRPGGGHGPEPAPPGPLTFPIFLDRTRESGIDFVHSTGAEGRKLLPETLGSGAAWLDYDGDGHIDLFLVDSGVWPWEESTEASPHGHLYRNRGDGRFDDVTALACPDLAIFGMGAVAADFDADGDPDLFLTALGGNRLLRNDGGRFVDATAEAGTIDGRWRDRDGAEHRDWSTAAVAFDADGDGCLDLFVGNYCCWTEETDIFTTLDGRTKAFTTPDRYRGLPCRLFLGDGRGHFRAAAPDPGLDRPLGKALGMALWDIDEDGRLDVLVANDTRPNFLFRNLGGGRFEEVGEVWGIAYDEHGRARAGMGIDAALLVPGERLTIAVGNFASEPLSLWQLDGGSFREVAARLGVAARTRAPLTFGLLFEDFDLDGILDLAVANGHIEPDIEKFDASGRHAQPAQLFRGLSDGRFADVSEQAGPDFVRPRVGRGLAAADWDGDGDLDLLLTTNGGAPALLENTGQPGASSHWLRVRLVDAGMNRSAIGARITVVAGGRPRTRLVRTGSSYLSQGDLAPTFGLGALDQVDRIEVTWPGGRRSEHRPLGIDREILIRR